MFYISIHCPPLSSCLEMFWTVRKQKPPQGLKSQGGIKLKLRWEKIGIPKDQQFCFDLIFSALVFLSRHSFCLESVMTRAKTDPEDGSG